MLDDLYRRVSRCPDPDCKVCQENGAIYKELLARCASPAPPAEVGGVLIRVKDLLRAEAEARGNPALVSLEHLTESMEHLIEQLSQEGSVYAEHASVATQILRRLDEWTKINGIPC